MESVRVSARSRSNRRSSLADNRRGAMLVFVAISMVALLGFLAMTLDVGAGGRQRRIAQTAADAGALGGAAEIERRQFGLVPASALAEAVRNGFDPADITVNYPPATGPRAGNNSYVEVLVNKSIPTIFGSLFNIASLSVATRAVAGVGSYDLNCLYSLDPSAPAALNIANGGELTTNCGVIINSSSPDALETNSSGDFSAGGSGIAVAGGWTGNKTPSPAPSIGTVAVPNPLDFVVMPTTVPACTSTGLVTVTKDTTLSPGVYCGGLYVDNKTATLSAGTYIFRGGGLEVRGGYFNGAGVTLINSIDPTNTYAFKPIKFGNGCKAHLSAPTSGTYPGILMFGDPAGPTGVTNTFACSSDVPPELTGALYFPTQKFLFDGSNSGTQLMGTIIAKQVEINGKVDIVMDTSGSTATKRKSLVE
jgi:hypothetical protein